MDLQLIYGGEASIEDLLILNGLGFAFDVEDGAITRIEFPKGWK